MNNLQLLKKTIDFLEYDEQTEKNISIDDFLAYDIFENETILKNKFKIFQFVIDRKQKEFLYIFAPNKEQNNIFILNSTKGNYNLLTKEEVIKKWIESRPIFEQKIFLLK